MKTYILSTSSVLAAAAALAVASVSVVASGVGLIAVGILAIFAEDYGRTIKPVSLPCETIRFMPAARALPGLREAA